MWRQSICMHSLLDNVFQIIFPTQAIKDYVIKNGPWNFNNKLCIHGLLHSYLDQSIWSSSLVLLSRNWPEIGFCLRNSLELEIRNMQGGLGQCFWIRALLCVYKPLCRCIMIHILGEGLIQAKVQYERLPHLCFYRGRIRHRYPQYEAKKIAFFDATKFRMNVLSYKLALASNDSLFSVLI